jgi:hypothetical protein
MTSLQTSIAVRAIAAVAETFENEMTPRQRRSEAADIARAAFRAATDAVLYADRAGLDKLEENLAWGLTTQPDRVE